MEFAIGGENGAGVNRFASGTGLDTGSGGGGSETEPESNVDRSSNWTPGMTHGGGAGGGEEEEPGSRWGQMERIKAALKMAIAEEADGSGVEFSEEMDSRFGGVEEYDGASLLDGAVVEDGDGTAAAARDDDSQFSSPDPLGDESGA